MPMAVIPNPPNEIWRFVFLFAADPKTSKTFASEDPPFHPTHSEDESLQVQCERLFTLYSIVQVCRQWHDLAEELLYEDVSVSSLYQLESLVQGLRCSAQTSGSDQAGRGRFIRRLQLLTERSPTQRRREPSKSSAAFNLLDILRLCSNLCCLVRHPLRRDDENIHLWSHLVEQETPLVYARVLPNLQRLDWYEGGLDSRMFGASNNRVLSAVLAMASGLQFLQISCNRQDVFTCLNVAKSVRMIKLDGFATRPARFSTNSMPPHQRGCSCLTRAVIHPNAVGAILPLLTAIGKQITFLEFPFSPHHKISSKQMHRILAYCPNIQELAYCLGAPELSPLDEFTDVQYTKLKTVRLRIIDPKEFHPYKHAVREQFDLLQGPSFPSLRIVVLHDPLRSFVRRDSAGTLLRNVIVDRGWHVEYEDGTLVSVTPA